MLLISEAEDINNLTKKVKEFGYSIDVDVIGIADVNNELFLKAPNDHQPKNILEGANSVIVLGKAIPSGVFKVKNYRSHALTRVHHSFFKFMDICAGRLANYVESLGFYAIATPAHIPFIFKTFKKPESWGMLSLKHAGVAAGLGRIAKDGLLIHPKYGTLLRLSSVITTAKLLPDPMIKEDICLECNLCVDNCTGNAFDADGKFDKFKCYPRTVLHAFKWLHPYNEEYIKNIEIITNTTFLEYNLGCYKCLEVCPLNNPKKK